MKKADVWQWISCRKRTCSVSLRVSILRATITGMRRSTTGWKNSKFKIDHYISTNNCKFRLFLQTLKMKPFKVQVKKAWTIFDKNGDGKLTPQEFRCIFLELGKKSTLCEKGGWNRYLQKDGLDCNITKWSRGATRKFCKKTIFMKCTFFQVDDPSKLSLWEADWLGIPEVWHRWRWQLEF